MADIIAPTASFGTDPSIDGKILDLLAVLDISCKLAASRDLQPLLENISLAARKVLDCECASVFLHDAQTHELYSLVVQGAEEVRFPADKGFAGEAFQSCKVINVPDAYADPRFNPEIDRKTGLRTRSILTCPLSGGDNKALGVLQVLNKRRRPFTAWDEVVAINFSALAGVAVQRQMLFEESLRRQRLERDLDIARKIQQGLFPLKPPAVPGFDVAGWNRPADETGGDFFDFKALPGGNLAVILADVAGHGIGPALVVAECRALVRATLIQTENLERLAGIVNRLLCEDVLDDRFVTAFFGILLPAESRLRYLSAGHGPILLFRAHDGSVVDLKANGCPLGFYPDLPYEQPLDIDFAPGDMLTVFTDGFFEWPNESRQRFGLERLRHQVREYHELPAADIIRKIYQDVVDFGAGTPQADDLTAVVIKKI